MTMLLLIAFAATLFNTGLIWTIQLVHYPGFLKVHPEAWSAYHQFHTQAITFIVGPSMMLELLSGIGMLTYASSLKPAWALWTATGCLALVWLHTAWVAIPLHNAAAGAFDKTILTQLVNTNWWRTIAWTLRSGLMLLMLMSVLKSPAN